jgi:hypothetical protein
MLIESRSVRLILLDGRRIPSFYPETLFFGTSIGRCFSFGMSEEGMLGLGEGIGEAHTPTEVSFPEESRSEKVVSVSAGASHVVALTRNGNPFAWRHKEFAGLVSSPRNSSADEVHTARSPGFEPQTDNKVRMARNTRPSCKSALDDNSILVPGVFS